MNNSKHVLIVDDEADIREGVGRWLNAAGYDTSTSNDGDEGIASVHRNEPSAILLDVQMPNKDGMETLAELQADATTFHIPVVMLSASMRDQQRALDAGARFFLQKPYDGKKLVAAVTTAITHNQQPRKTHHE